MGSKTKLVFVILSFLAQWYCVAHLRAEPIRTNNRGAAQEIFVPVPLPGKDRLTLVSFVPMIAQGKVFGRLAAYDDVATRRPADYLELYDNAGILLAVGWFDKFGIERLAVDRAFVKHADNLEGVFVLILKGDSV